MAKADPSVVVAVIAGAGTIIGATITVAWSRRSDRQMASQEARRSQKTKVYEDFMKFWFETLFHEQLGVEAPDASAVQQFFVNFTREAIPWTSDGFIREYADFRRLFSQSADTPEGAQVNAQSSIFQFEEILREIRSDLGHANRNIAPKTILALFINDIDEIPDPRPTQRRSR